MTKGYGDRFPDTPARERNTGGFNTAGEQLSSIHTPTTEERAQARRYLERVAPDLVEVLGLA